MALQPRLTLQCMHVSTACSVIAVAYLRELHLLCGGKLSSFHSPFFELFAPL